MSKYKKDILIFAIGTAFVSIMILAQTFYSGFSEKCKSVGGEVRSHTTLEQLRVVCETKTPTKKMVVVDVPIYNQRITVLIGCATTKECSDLVDEELSGAGAKKTVLGLSEYNNAEMTGGYYSGATKIIMLKHSGVHSQNVGTIAHESGHAAVDILNTAGIGLTTESQEAYSYLIGYITGEIVEQVYK